jgi:hypothetical protein
MYMSSTKHAKFGQPIFGQQEVCGISHKNSDTEWFAAEGVYLPRTDSSKKKKSKGKAAKDETAKTEL